MNNKLRIVLFIVLHTQNKDYYLPARLRYYNGKMIAKQSHRLLVFLQENLRTFAGNLIMDYKDTNVYVTASHALIFTNKKKHLSCNKNVVILLKRRIHQQYGYRFPFFYVQRSVLRKYIPCDIFPTRCNFTHFIYFWKTALHVSGGIPNHHQEHIQLYLQYLVLVKVLPLPAAIVDQLKLKPPPNNPQQRQVAVTVKQVPDTVNTIVCAPDDGWGCRAKHVEQFSRNK